MPRYKPQFIGYSLPLKTGSNTLYCQSLGLHHILLLPDHCTNPSATEYQNHLLLSTSLQPLLIFLGFVFHHLFQLFQSLITSIILKQAATSCFRLQHVSWPHTFSSFISFTFSICSFQVSLIPFASITNLPKVFLNQLKLLMSCLHFINFLQAIHNVITPAMILLVCLAVLPLVFTQCSFCFFLSPMGWHTLPSHASAETCLTGWPNVQPQG